MKMSKFFLKFYYHCNNKVYYRYQIIGSMTVMQHKFLLKKHVPCYFHGRKGNTGRKWFKLSINLYLPYIMLCYTLLGNATIIETFQSDVHFHVFC